MLKNTLQRSYQSRKPFLDTTNYIHIYHLTSSMFDSSPERRISRSQNIVFLKHCMIGKRRAMTKRRQWSRRNVEGHQLPPRTLSRRKPIRTASRGEPYLRSISSSWTTFSRDTWRPTLLRVSVVLKPITRFRSQGLLVPGESSSAPVLQVSLYTSTRLPSTLSIPQHDRHSYTSLRARL